MLCAPYEMKEDEIGRKCGTCGGERRNVNSAFWWGKLKGKDNLKILHVDGRIILKCILKK